MIRSSRIALPKRERNMAELSPIIYAWCLPFLVAWSIACFCIAVYFCKCLDASRNPIEWIPFFVLGPVICAVTVLAGVLLIPLALLFCLFALVAYPFGKVVAITPSGLVLHRRIGKTEQLLCWTEIAQWKTVESYSFDTHFVSMTEGGTVMLPPLDFRKAIPFLTMHDISVVSESV